MDKYNIESLHDWTYQELFSEVERLDKMEFSPDKITKLMSLEKVTDLYRRVTKSKRYMFENDHVDDYLKEYDLVAFFDNGELYDNYLRLKNLKGWIKEILLKEKIKLGFEMNAEAMNMERTFNPGRKPSYKLMN
jgi:hypothetical protein